MPLLACCQLEEAEGRPGAAQTVYASGLKRCPDCVPLWRAAARLEEGQGNVGRARALLEQVRGCLGCWVFWVGKGGKEGVGRPGGGLRVLLAQVHVRFACFVVFVSVFEGRGTSCCDRRKKKKFLE